MTTLMFAASAVHSKVVKALLNAGANINAQNNIKETALTAAIRNNHSETVQLLLKFGAN